jgi:hypothetical protein
MMVSESSGETLPGCFRSISRACAFEKTPETSSFEGFRIGTGKRAEHQSKIHLPGSSPNRKMALQYSINMNKKIIETWESEGSDQ